MTKSLIAALAFGIGLRLYGLDWGMASLRGLRDGGRGISIQEAFHPDESALAEATASLRESIHPHLRVQGEPYLYSVYGPVFMYLFQGAARGLSLAVEFTPFDLGDPHSADWTRRAGRAVSALAGCATLWLTYRLGAVAFDRTVGVLASLLLGATALHIQSSHFCTVDVLMTMWATWSFLPMARVASSGARREYLAAAVLIALAAATKLNALVLFLPLVLAHALNVRRQGLRLTRPRAHEPLLLGAAAFLLAFALLVPSAWLRPADYFGPDYYGNALFSARLNEGGVIMRGSLHYADTPPYLYQLLHHFPAGMGVALEVATILGCLQALARRTRADLLIAGFALVYGRGGSSIWWPGGASTGCSWATAGASPEGGRGPRSGPRATPRTLGRQPTRQDRPIRRAPAPRRRAPVRRYSLDGMGARVHR